MSLHPSLRRKLLLLPTLRGYQVPHLETLKGVNRLKGTCEVDKR